MSIPTTKLPLFQVGAQFVNKDGRLTPVAAQFMQFLMTRVGGALAPSNTQINQTLVEVMQAPAPVILNEADEGEGFVIPGPRGAPGPTGPLGALIYLSDNSDSDNWTPVFGPHQ